MTVRIWSYRVRRRRPVMTTRIALATMVGVAALGGAAGGAWSKTDAARSCGTVTAAGTSWQVVAASAIPCTTARALVRKLAAKVPASGVAHAEYRGFQCVGLAGKGKRALQCLDKRGGSSSREHDRGASALGFSSSHSSRSPAASSRQRPRRGTRRCSFCALRTSLPGRAAVPRTGRRAEREAVHGDLRDLSRRHQARGGRLDRALAGERRGEREERSTSRRSRRTPARGRRSARSRTLSRASPCCTLPRYGDEQYADYLPKPTRPHGQLIVRKGNVVWYLTVENCTPLAMSCYGTSRTEAPIGKAKSLSELKKYGAKQKARAGSG